MRRRVPPIFLALVALTAPGCGERGDAETAVESATTVHRDGSVTFSRDVAPIVFEHCAACHQPDGSGPFTLLTYDDVRKRARQIADVTASGFMPPWLPDPGYGQFVGERRLGAHEIETLRRWVDDGAIEGDPADLPEAPRVTAGWQLGEPDLVATMPVAFTLPAEGTDVFRNFVVPVPDSARRFVRAVELRPGNKRIVHHAIVMVDRTRQSRRLDGEDAEPGYAGMDSVYGQAPDGHFLGWTPGKVADANEGSLPWRLEPGTDLVLQLHMVPSGKPETIQPSVGLYFGDPPQSAARTVTLYMKTTVDIPPGATAYEAVDRFVLPVDAWVERVYPHAHYLGKAIEAYATLPDGTTTWLIRISDWDFNWQDSYRFNEPLRLPAGTTVTMRWTFDNSADNIRNPNHPPRRVVSGNNTTDEMAHLYIQVRVENGDAELALTIAETGHRLLQAPGDWSLHTSLAGLLQSAGRYPEAVDHCQRALELKPDHAPAHYCLALIFELHGRLDEASARYEQAVALQPDDPLLRTSLAEVQVKQGRLAEAEGHARQVLQVDPQIGDAQVVLGNIRRLEGRLAEATDHYRRAIAIQPDDVRGHAYLASISAQQGQFEQAAAHLEHALRIAPDSAALHSSMGRVLLAQGRTDEAIEQLRRALAIDPSHAEARQVLQAATSQ